MTVKEAIYVFCGIFVLSTFLICPAWAQTLSETSEYETRISDARSIAYSEPERAREMAEELFVTFKEANDPVGQARARRIIAITYAPSGDWDTVRAYFLEALTYINEADHTELYVRNLQSLGASYTNEGLYDKAFEYNAQALSVSEMYDYEAGTARSNYFLGVIMINIYDNKAAIEYQLAAIENGQLQQSTLVSAYKSLGNAYRYDGQQEKSLPYFEKSISIDPEQSPFSKALTYNYHAEALIDLERYDEAEAIANKALQLSEANDFPEYRCRARQSLGSIALARGAPEQALLLLDLNNCGLDDISEEYQIATDIEVLPDMIRAYLSTQQTQEALVTFDRLIESQEKNFNATRASALGVAGARLELAQSEGRIAFLEQQDELNAVRLQQRGLIALSAILTTIFVLIAGAISYRGYQTQKRANGVLRSRNLLSTSKVQAAEKSLEHKTLLIHEINHRVKNNLQTIISLLNTQRRRLGPAATDEAASILVDVCRRVETMAIVQQRLNELEEANRLYSNPFIVDLVSRLITSSGRRVETTFDVDDICLSADTAAPLALIINELVSNALKHAFDDSGRDKLHIELKPIGNSHYQLTCQDNGAGLPKEFDLGSLGTFGLSIIQSLAEQIFGQLEYEEANPGTKWIVIFQASRDVDCDEV